MRCTARDFGGIASVRLLTHRAWLLTDPAVVESVLIDQADKFRKHCAVRILPIALGNGLLTSEGDFYKRQRRLIQPSFQRSYISVYADIFIDQTRQMLANWHSGQERDILQEMHALTLSTAARTLFGSFADSHHERVREALRIGQAEFVRRFTSIIKIPTWVPTPGNVRLRRAAAALDEIIYGFIRNSRASKSEGTDLLSRLIHARDESDRSDMTDKQLRDECLTIFLAGQETSALALAWCWHLLSEHPEMAESIHQEVDDVLFGQTPTMESLPRLQRIEHVILETMRLYPPIYVIGREALVDTELGGYQCRRGTSVLIPIWAIHRNETYFESPDEFRPDRWKNDFFKTLPKGAYIPFSTGPRTCVGTHFAMTQMKLVIAMIAQQFRFTKSNDQPITLNAQVTLQPSPGVRAKLELRQERSPVSSHDIREGSSPATVSPPPSCSFHVQ